MTAPPPNIASGSASTIGGGQSNTASNTHSFIGGGYRNTASATCSTIGGGCNNLIESSTYSSILGGKSNNITNYYNSHIIGSKLTANASNTTFVNYLNKQGGTFSIDHPNPSLSCSLRLNHSFVESPTEGDNIYRYTVVVNKGTATIDLPDYFQYLNKDVQIWVTPTDSFAIAYGKINEEYTQVTIYGNDDKEFNVLIVGTRKDKNTKFWKGVVTPQPSNFKNI